ncbi:MAG: LptF/LptG family permease [Verrucomicrobia bacterium]|nr:LptF/LptG family permease [Verrucomicrobiota bacterium]
MRTLHLYLTRQVLAGLVMTVAVFAFVLLLGNVLREVLTLLVNRQAPWLAILHAIGLLIPFVLAFALPMGLLTATLLVFGRFSADQELTAARAGGVSLLSLVSPILLLSAALSGVCAFVNLHVAPASRVAYKRLLFEMGLKRSDALLPEKTFIKDFPGHVVYLGKVKGNHIEDIIIINLKDQQVESHIRAARGELNVDAAAGKIRVKLWDAWSVDWVRGKREPGYAGEAELPEIDIRAPVEDDIKVSNMTFRQLQNELRAMERLVGAPIPALPSAPRDPARLAALRQRHAADLTAPVRIQMHRQVSFSFACIGFTLVGIPLGIRAHRRETTFGIAVALLLVAVYYGGFIFAQGLESRPELLPHLVVWLPNFVFQIVGIILLWRANRGI